MIGKLTLAGLLAVGLFASVQTVSAAPAPPSTIGTTGASLVQKTQYRGYCREWRRECAARWGWRSPRYFSCLERRGC